MTSKQNKQANRQNNNKNWICKNKTKQNKTICKKNHINFLLWGQNGKPGLLRMNISSYSIPMESLGTPFTFCSYKGTPRESITRASKTFWRNADIHMVSYAPRGLLGECFYFSNFWRKRIRWIEYKQTKIYLAGYFFLMCFYFHRGKNNWNMLKHWYQLPWSKTVKMK